MDQDNLKTETVARNFRHTEAVQPEQPACYVNGDELDNMLNDRTAVVQSDMSGYRKTPLYRATTQTEQPVEWQGRVGDEWRRIDPPKGETLENRVEYLRNMKREDGKPVYEIRALYTSPNIAQPEQPTEKEDAKDVVHVEKPFIFTEHLEQRLCYGEDKFGRWEAISQLNCEAISPESLAILVQGKSWFLSRCIGLIQHEIRIYSDESTAIARQKGTA